MNTTSSEAQRKSRAFEKFVYSRGLTPVVGLSCLAGLLLFWESTRRAAKLSCDFPFSIDDIRLALLNRAKIEISFDFLHSLAADSGGSDNVKLAIDILLREFWDLNEERRHELAHWVTLFDWESDSDQAPLEVQEFLVESTQLLFGNRHNNGAYSTPLPVRNLMLELGSPAPGETVYDPCFGTGSLLLGSADWVRSKFGVSALTLLGSEVNPNVFALAFVRLFLAGLHFDVKNGDTLKGREGTAYLGRRADLVLATLPFGLRVDTRHLTKEYEFPTSEASLLFLQHIMNSLAPGGRAVVCAAQGLLFSMGAGAKVREKLLREFDLQSVVSLPPGTFAPYSQGLRAGILTFRHATSSGTVRFLEVPALEGMSERFARGKTRLSPIDIRAKLKSGIGEYFNAAPIPTILANGADLSARRYMTPETTVPDLDFPFQSLQQLAQLWQGVAYRSLEIEAGAQLRSDSDRVGLIRISDLQEGKLNEVRAPAIFAPREGFSTKRLSQMLQIGDLLLASVGSKVKVALVGPEAVGAFATNNLFVVRAGESISPRYLLGVFRSALFQDWFISQLSGATVQRITLNALREFAVPIIPYSLQREIEKRLLTSGGDVFSLLGDANARNEVELLWPGLEKWAAELGLFKFDPLDEATTRRFLGRASQSFAPIFEAMTHTTLGLADSQNVAWIAPLEATTRWWSDLELVPPGPTRLWLLERIQAGLREANLRLESLESQQAQKRKVIETLQNLVSVAGQDLFVASRVEVSFEPETISAGRENEINVCLRNASPLPLRQFGIILPGFGWQRDVVFFPENTTIRLPFSVFAPQNAATLDLPFVWEASRLDGQEAEGMGHLNLSVEEPEPEEWPPLGSNPYITGDPIPSDREEMVFGREEILREVRSQLSQSGSANTFFFIGNRRAGKSTLLAQIQAKPPEGWLPVLVSFQQGEGDQNALLDNREFFRLLGTAVLEAAIKIGIRLQIPGTEAASQIANPLIWQSKLRNNFALSLEQIDKPFDFFHAFIASALHKMAPRRLLLMVDEFDKLPQSIEKGVATQSVPENLRALVQSENNLSFIIAGSHRLMEFTQGYWATFFGMGSIKKIAQLSGEAARDLVTKPLAGRIRFTDAACNRIITLCANHAYLIQGFCVGVFEWVARTDNRRITEATVNSIAKEFLTHSAFLGGLWLDAETQRRRFLLLLCANDQDKPELLTFEALRDRLIQDKINFRVKDLDADFRFLSNLGALKKENGSYSIAIPLFGQWIKSQHHLSVQLEAAREESLDIF